MSKHMKVSRSFKSWAMANIIIHYNLIDDFVIWCTKHPAIKSKYRAGNLFLLHKGLRYSVVPERFSVNMDTLRSFYYGD